MKCKSLYFKSNSNYFTISETELVDMTNLIDNQAKTGIS